MSLLKDIFRRLRVVNEGAAKERDHCFENDSVFVWNFCWKHRARIARKLKLFATLFLYKKKNQIIKWNCLKFHWTLFLTAKVIFHIVMYVYVDRLRLIASRVSDPDGKVMWIEKLRLRRDILHVSVSRELFPSFNESGKIPLKKTFIQGFPGANFLRKKGGKEIEEEFFAPICKDKNYCVVQGLK